MDRGRKIKGKWGWIALCSLIVTVFIVLKCRDFYRNEALQNSTLTWAIITQKVHCSAKGACSIRYKFWVTKNKVYESRYAGEVIQECRDDLKEGDTVFIRYAVSDPEVTELLHCYWNDRLRKQMDAQTVRK